MKKWLITGANGNLGRRLISYLIQNTSDEVVALVRSQRAQHLVAELADPEEARLAIAVVDYLDVDAVRAAADKCTHAVHLVGILKEARGASYQTAHQDSTAALLAAAAQTDIAHVSYLSIVGSHPQSPNACLASKGAAESLLLEHALDTCVLRVPMVLGEGDYASFALAKRAQASVSFAFRPSSLEQPIYAGDVVRAIVAAADGAVDASLDLGGPEVLTRRALTRRAAAVLGRSTKIIALPLFMGYAFAWLAQSVIGNPPLTTAMLGVLNHDDEVDPSAALQALQLGSLVEVDAMLQHILVT